MANLKFIKPKKINLKNHPLYNERWIQNHIVEDPTLLGLGDDIIVKDEERHQPHAGRLDLLLQDSQNSRYEVEIQLGKLDESHIIRTIEYWDLEKKRYPQYEHCAVIVAEEITSRFLNVIQLFNGHIPLIAIQMTAYQLEEYITLEFTTVLNQIVLGIDDEDDSIREVVDREYWKNKRGTPKTISVADNILKLINSFDDKYELKYNKHYIGLAKNGMPNNIITIKPLKKFTWLTLPGMDETDQIVDWLDEIGADYQYYKKWQTYEIRLFEGDIKKNEELFTKIFNHMYELKGH
jgi:hypothetical protein